MPRCYWVWGVLFWVSLSWVPAAWAQTECGDDASAKQNREPKAVASDALPPARLSKTRHVLKLQDGQLEYSAVAGTLPVEIRRNGPLCRIFFIAYHLQGVDPASRPLTFVFNGGPGASSAYLHLGALGPKMVPFGKGGVIPPYPAGLVDNPRTWLRFTDLVFVDPVGTGYSRCEDSCAEGKKEKGETAAWGVKEDFTSVAKFMRLYLTRERRWMSPKYLAGESYGGFRAAGVSGPLRSEYGIGVNGMILISPALEFGSLNEGEYRLLPWILRVPSYAATARRHGKAPGGPPHGNMRRALEDVERFAVHDLLPALAAGKPDPVAAQLAAFIGMSEQWVRRLRARVPLVLYVKDLLSPSNRLISVYDGSRTAIDPDPGDPLPRGEDALLARINLLLAPAFNAYIREELGYRTDLRYNILNRTVSEKWNWASGMTSDQGFVGAAGALKTGMSVNGHLKVLIAHGVFDLVTPYFGSVMVARQMALDPSIASNLLLKVYEGGHMFYTHQRGRVDFFEDVRKFYHSAPKTVNPVHSKE